MENEETGGLINYPSANVLRISKNQVASGTGRSIKQASPKKMTILILQLRLFFFFDTLQHILVCDAFRVSTPLLILNLQPNNAGNSMHS